MTPILYAFRGALLHLLWQGVLISGLLWLALYWLRKRSANARYLVSCAALAVMAILPGITTWLLYATPAMATPVTHAAASVPAAVAVFSRVAPSVTGRWLAAVQAWILPIWSAGVLLLSLRVVVGWRQIAVLRRRGQEAAEPLVSALAAVAERMGVTRRVRLLVSAVADGPSVAGWIRPVILLPAAAVSGLTPEQLESILAHELAHIRRYDHAVNLVQLVLETLFFYHPAVWWISGRIRHERELCCDDLAVRASHDAVCYARALTTLERLRLATPALALGSTQGPLMYRIQRIVGAAGRASGPSRASGLVTLVLGAICLGLTIHGARGQEAVRGFSLTVTHEDPAVDLGGATLRHRGPIEYPEELRAKGIEGTVIVEVTLDERGKVDDAHVVSGPMELRRVALSSVLNWHFVPETAGSTHEVRITFHSTNGDSNRTILVPGIMSSVEIVRKPIELEVQDGHVQIGSDRRLVTVTAGSLTLTENREGPQNVAGQRLERIGVEGVADSEKGQLLSRLGIHLGDTITDALMEKVASEANKFDEHIRVVWRVPEDKATGVTLQLSLNE